MSSTPYSPQSYAALIRTLKSEGYAFAPFTVPSVEGKAVFLRHDVDYSLHWAEQVARINAEIGASGTFFIQVRSPLYNLFSFDSIAALRTIAQLGQFIGLHLSIRPEHRTREVVGELLDHDFRLLRDCIDVSQPVFAWHNPSVCFSESSDLIGAAFEGFVNAYGEFGGGRHPYYADSNLRYSVQELRDIICRGEPTLQLALAPMQWMAERVDMLSILARNLTRKIRDFEIEFQLNHVYRATYPHGLSQDLLDDFEAEVAKGSQARVPLCH